MSPPLTTYKGMTLLALAVAIRNAPRQGLEIVSQDLSIPVADLQDWERMVGLFLFGMGGEATTGRLPELTERLLSRLGTSPARLLETVARQLRLPTTAYLHAAIDGLLALAQQLQPPPADLDAQLAAALRSGRPPWPR